MKKLLLILVLLFLINPCFAKPLKVNKIYVDLENYLAANGSNMTCIADIFYYQYKFYETYSYPTGWSKKVMADVGISVAQSPEVTEFSPQQENIAALEFKAYYLPILKAQYEQAYKDPNLGVRLPKEAMDAGLRNALRKDF